MLFSNFKIAFRVFRRQKLFTLINTTGLAIGITGVCLVYLFVLDELSYDNFHSKKDRISRVIVDFLDPYGALQESVAHQPLPLGPSLNQDFPEIESYTRVSRQQLYVKNGQNVQEESMVFVDPSALNIFSFPLIHGNIKDALDKSKSILLSEELALKYFGHKDVLGESLKIQLQEQFEEYVITGVLQNIPPNSSIQADAILGYSDLPYHRIYKNSWGLSTDETYLLLRENTDLDMLNKKIARQWTKYLPEEVEAVSKGEEPDRKYRLQPLEDIHLDVNTRSATVASDPKHSFILGGIALLILFVACANFTTLSLARSANRNKEIGVRKVVGAKRRQLTLQFWVEALILSFFGLILALFLVFAMLPTFNALTRKYLELQGLFSIESVCVLLTVTLLSSLLAGTYPALLLSRMRVTQVLKQKSRIKGANLFTRALITAQFISVLLLTVGTMVMVDQLDFLKNTSLGFEAEDVIVINNEFRYKPEEFEVLRAAFNQNPNVLNISQTSSSFTKGSFGSSFVLNGKEVFYSMFKVEPQYFETLGIDIVEGRAFDVNLSTDSSAVVVNKAFMETMGSEFKVGDRLKEFENGGQRNPRVIGVTNDYHFESLTNRLKPTILMIDGLFGFSHILVRTKNSEASTVLSELRDIWYDIAPEMPFSASLLSEDMNREYASEDRWMSIIKWSSYLAIMIAIVGLFGLVSLSVSGKLKEISVRKVLGAQVYHIFFVLFRPFRTLLLLSFLISIPLSYYVLNIWLDSFAYHVNVKSFSYLLSGFGLIGIIAFVVSSGVLKAIISNPINSLREE